MSDKLWGGRFEKDLTSLAEDFNESISFDKELAEVDIEGSLAHAQMLRREGILSENDYCAIKSGLEKIREDIKKQKVTWKKSLEDIHMNIESLLTERVGEAGKRLHTARSRNDQVATDMMLYVRNAAETIIEDLYAFLKVLVEKARPETETVMPGYTHLQRAQPITYAHYLLAYCEMLLRDISRFEFVLGETSSASPLGAGALATSTYPIDREYTAKLLDFEDVKRNSLDAVSDRDYAVDFLEGCALVMMHLSRLCEEIILYNSAEFGFFILDDAYATGSSIMPQKKNPDFAELVRGKTGRVYGNLIALLTTMKGLPLAYNKDMQEDKEPVFDSFKTVSESLKVITEVVRTLTLNRERMREASAESFLNATDMADWLVKHGLPFRDAHAVIGELVLKCEKEGKKLEELSIKELTEVSPVFDESVYSYISLESMLENRDIIGSPSPDHVKEELERFENILTSYFSS